MVRLLIVKSSQIKIQIFSYACNDEETNDLSLSKLVRIKEVCKDLRGLVEDNLVYMFSHDAKANLVLKKFQYLSYEQKKE